MLTWFTRLGSPLGSDPREGLSLVKGQHEAQRRASGMTEEESSMEEHVRAYHISF